MVWCCAVLHCWLAGPCKRGGPCSHSPDTSSLAYRYAAGRHSFTAAWRVPQACMLTCITSTDSRLLLASHCPCARAPHAARAHLDDAVWHAHLLAQSGQPHHQLDGVHVVGDHHQLSLLVLNQGGDVVDAVLDDDGLLLVALLAWGTAGQGGGGERARMGR